MTKTRESKNGKSSSSSVKDNLVRNLPGNKINLVKFYSPTCPACVSLGNRVPEVQQKYPHVNWVDIDVNHRGDLAEAFGIRALPTIFIYKGTTEAAMIEGNRFEVLMDKIGSYSK